MAGLVGLASFPNTAEGQPGFTASSVTDTSVTLTWSPGMVGGCPDLFYDVTVGSLSRNGIRATTVTVTGLKPGTKYSASIIAAGSCGWSDDYAYTTFTTTGGVAKPTGLKATGGAQRITLSWSNPGDASIMRWEYQQRVFPRGIYGSWTAIGNSSATTTTYTVTGLTNGTAYAFKVRAVGAGDAGPASDEVTAAPLPAKLTGVTATGGAQRVTLSWAHPKDWIITHWEYQQKTGAGSYGSWTVMSGLSPLEWSYTVTGLSSGTGYAFKVRAVNASGAGPASDEATARTAPAKPTGFTATGGEQQVTLSWTNPGDASITRWEYQQRRGTFKSYGRTWTAIGSSSATTTTHVVTGLTSGTGYGFKVRAVNASGNSVASDEAIAATAGVPAMPEGIGAKGGIEQMVLSWVDPQNPTITRWEYQQQRELDLSFEWSSWIPIPGSSATTTTYTVRGLRVETARESYAYRIRAVNPAGNGVVAGDYGDWVLPAPALMISVSDVSVTEGDSGTTAMNFTVTLSGSPSHKVEIRATARGVGMAAALGRTPPTAMGTGYGRDFFQFTGRNLVFEAGATGAALTKTVTVSVYGDQLEEDDETLILRLNNLRTEATNVSFAGGETSLEATGTISDDDEGKTPREISVSNTSVTEGAEGDRTELTFTITLSATPTHEVRIRATVRGAGIKATLATTPTAKGTAGEGRDFIRFTNRNIVFEAGATGAALTQTVKVVILGDAVVEGDETLSLRLNNLRTDDGLVRFTGGAKRLFATGTITDDDSNN